jgi:hypothetical protein
MRKISGLIFLATPSYAYAWDDGQDALFLATIQLVIVVLSLAIFAFRRLSLARRGYAFLGCIVGVIISWVVSSLIPFSDNRGLVTDVCLYLPIIGFFTSLGFTEKPRTAWKSYFYFFLALSAPSITPFVYYSTLEWLVDLSFILVLSVGLFGLAWKKPIFNRQFWKVFVPICVIYNIGHSLAMIQTIEPLITTLLAMPSLAGVWLFAYKTNQIWQHSTSVASMKQSEIEG